MSTALVFDLTYYPVAVVSCVFFLFVFHYASPVVSRWLFPGLNDIPVAKQTYWHASMCSTVHALITSSFCVYSLIYEHHLVDDPVWNTSPSVSISCAIVIGYMAADTIIMMSNYDKIGDVNYLLHHAASVYAYYYVLSYGVYSYFANFRLMAEFSTPWVNNRWFLDTMNKKSSQAYFINGLVLTAVFFACRILTLPWCWYRIYSIYGTEPFDRTGNIRFVLIISCFALDALNIIWFHKLVKGARKQLQKYDKNANKSH